MAKAYPDAARPGRDDLARGAGGEGGRAQQALSGGQRRRLDLALALVGDPELVFLDEPTTGFDPAARRNAWGVVSALRDLGKTVLLTTHYLDEAQALADRVAIVKDGADRGPGPAERAGAVERRATRSPTSPAAGGSSTRPTTPPTSCTA